MREENQLLDELIWLNYQSGSLMVLCNDIINERVNESQLKWVLIQINACISQIEETLQTQIPKPENHIKCPKCGGENFVICEYGVWDAEPVWDESKRKWILSATSASDSGIDLIECKVCIRNSASDDLTENFIHEVEFNG